MKYQLFTVYTFQRHDELSDIKTIFVGYFEVIYIPGDFHCGDINILVRNKRVVEIDLKPNEL